ncbi:MAG: ABC transporter substrate-binding protein [Coriobacteriales bacterium]|jgi:NitT/TauT family transport system substrate-binding protein
MRKMQGKWWMLAVLALAFATMLALAGCGGSGSGDEAAPAEEATADTPSLMDVDPGPVKIGTLATEDILPMWVAADEGLFDEAGLDVEVVPFQSATELIAGVTSGDVQMAMTDPMVTASLYAGGTDVRIVWVTLGMDASQGRFGIMTAPGSGIETLEDLAGVPIGVGSNTILEYVMDALMADAGIPADQVVVEELQKLPVRYQAMVNGDVKAAALPGPLLALGEANGCVLVADDTAGDNISQSVMIMRSDFAETEQGAAALARIAPIWDAAADLINANPESYRELLAKNANLSDEVAGTYPICEYPHAQLPAAEMVDPVLDWMVDKGYLTEPLSYDAITGTFSKA